jgi:hypothetical protein
MRRGLLVLALAVVAAMLLAIGGVARAAGYTDSVSGLEYFATSTDGKFAGTASGSLPGGWNADVQHTPLCVSCTPTATITGGSFALATTVDDIPTLISGRFSSGTIQVTNAGPNCTKQTFLVSGTLADVGAYGGSGSGTFDVTLTHYRRSLFGRCVTYGASVTGTLSLTSTA